MALLLLSCDETRGEGREASERVATKWAEAYFNYDFERAAKYVTPESRKWLAFAASNVYQADIDVLRAQEQGARVSMDGYEATSDSSCVVCLEVDNFLLRDSIGKAGHIVSGCRFNITLVRREGRLMVRMEDLPRSEKRSRD